MRFAVMSDSHDHLQHVRDALKIIKNENCEMIIHCGDFVAPFVLKEFEAAGIPTHCVFGNNDGDPFLLSQVANGSNGLITLYGVFGKMEKAGKTIAFVHEGFFAEGLAATGKYDMVFFGHSHRQYQDQIGDCLLLNPGDIMGKDAAPGFCIVDTEGPEIRHITIS